LADIGKTFQDRRKELGLTQERFAEIMDVNVNSIKYIEQGRRIPSMPMFLRILKALKLSITLSPRR